MSNTHLPRLLPAALLLFACRPQVPAQSGDAAEAQAQLAADTVQARLWRQAQARPALEMQAVRPDSLMVRPATRQPVPEPPVSQRPERPFDPSVDAGLVLVDAPVFETPFSGAARVAAVNGEFLTLDFGNAQTLRLHAKVGGAPLRAQPGEQAQLLLSHGGEPQVANDRLVVRLPQDDLLYALVGSNSLVRLSLPPFRMTAEQIEPVANNTAAVRVTVGGETHVVRHGETVTFDTGSLTIRVLASITVRGQAANALPGEPNRLHILGWRTRPAG